MAVEPDNTPICDSATSGKWDDLALLKRALEEAANLGVSAAAIADLPQRFPEIQTVRELALAIRIHAMAGAHIRGRP